LLRTARVDAAYLRGGELQNAQPNNLDQFRDGKAQPTNALPEASASHALTSRHCGHAALHRYRTSGQAINRHEKRSSLIWFAGFGDLHLV
jgi:hypothetical protein